MKKFIIDREKDSKLFDEVLADTTRIDMAEQFQQKLRQVGKLMMIKTLELALEEITDGKDGDGKCPHDKVLAITADALEKIDEGLDDLITEELTDIRAAMIDAYGDVMDTQFAVERVQKAQSEPVELHVQVLGDDYKHDSDEYIQRTGEMPAVDDEVIH